MPLVRIDLRKGKDVAYRQAAARVVYEAMRSVGVPEHDQFEIITEHPAENLIIDREYLGIQRSDDAMIIQITWNEGRTTDQKKALFAAIADGLHEAIGLRKEDVFVNIVEVKRENWSFGNGIAQYAS